MPLTSNELTVLKAFDDSEYGDYLTDPIWTFSITCSIEGKALSGVFSSLTKKGYIDSDGSGDEAVSWMTKEGVDTFVKAVGEDTVQKELNIED